MPIIIKDFEWCETDSKVEITIPLKGVKAGNVDIFSTNRYLKACYYPLLLLSNFLHFWLIIIAFLAFSCSKII